VRPTHAQEFGMVLAGRWYRLRVRPADRAEPGAARDAGPVARLPVTLLARTIIEPLFGITDPRTDQRIDFVGGGRGLAELERLVTSGEMAAAFALYPTQMRDLMAVADAGAVMPPKSTWFEPKLADGMVSTCSIDSASYLCQCIPQPPPFRPLEQIEGNCSRSAAAVTSSAQRPAKRK
jgi:uncharacterized protein (DUF1015 family)